MAIRDIVPAWRGRGNKPARRQGSAESLLSLQSDINRIFDDFFHGFGLAPYRGLSEHVTAFVPKVDVAETDKEVRVTAELPGMDEKDVEVMLDNDVLTIRGEKKDEHEQKKGSFYRMERTYGSFQRSIQIPGKTDAEKVKASFKKGILTVTLPKVGGEKAGVKKIAVKTD